MSMRLLYNFLLKADIITSIISVTSYSAILSQPDSPPNKHKKTSFFSSSPHVDGASGSWLGFFFKLFLLAGVVGGGYYGWQEYQRRQRYGGFGNGGGGRIGGAYGMRTPGINDGFGDIYGGKRY